MLSHFSYPSDVAVSSAFLLRIPARHVNTILSAWWGISPPYFSLNSSGPSWRAVFTCPTVKSKNTKDQKLLVVVEIGRKLGVSQLHNQHKFHAQHIYKYRKQRSQGTFIDPGMEPYSLSSHGSLTSITVDFCPARRTFSCSYVTSVLGGLELNLRSSNTVAKSKTYNK